ncbi:MAG TPA: CHRD domain-containing protein [Bryobacteraceae bacterium]|nr:CHRD domain-containing protein [Bryobacteraceae bacterium]
MAMKAWRAAGSAACLIWLAAALAAQGQETYKVRLSPVPADQKTRPDLAGSGSLTATLSGNKLSITGSFEGLKAPATMAELRGGVMAGVRGPVIAPLAITNATSGTINGSADLTPQQLTNLRKNGLYVQIYSEKTQAEGVLWGWLLK